MTEPTQDRARHFVADQASLERLCAAIAADAVIGLDTESNGFFAYTERLCLLQVATTGADWVVDPLALDLKPLVPLLADPAREVILHAAEFDVTTLRRELGLVFGRIFDTHAAAKVLGIVRVGLGNLVEDTLGIKLTEDEQRSDWGRRPLTPTQISYAYADVRYLLPLRAHLLEKLSAQARLREAEAEFERLRHKEARPKVFDPDGWMKLKSARSLDGKGRGILKELFALREARAQELDRPPFKVLSELFLAEVAVRKPADLAALEKVPGASARQLEKLGPQLLAAVQAGLAGEPLALPRLPKGSDARFGKHGRPPPEVEERYELLRTWRKQKAEARKVEVQVIAPNSVLMALAKAAPRTLEELAHIEGMDAFRREEHGQELIALFAKQPQQPGLPGFSATDSDH